MLIWVIYDISSNRDRSKVAKECLEHGLQRIQKSVFLGDLPPQRADEIAEFSKDLIDPETDAVFILPCCDSDFQKRIVIGNKTFDEELVKDTKTTFMI